MACVTQSLDVRRDLSAVYDQWTQFESFPQFMEGVKEVRRLDDRRLHWVAEIAGREREWDAEITEQVTDQRIAWRAVSGAANGGLVTFVPLSGGITRIHLRIEYEMLDWIEKAVEVTGIVAMRVRGDLVRFKEFIEAQGEATGVWHDRMAA